MADIARTRAPVPTAPWRMIALALVVFALIVTAALIYVGSHHPVPAPFGPAKNGLIPYAADGDLYLGDPVTGQTRPLVVSPDVESGAITSPDGTRVAFARDVAGSNTTDVYVIGIDGSNLRRITAAPIPLLKWGAWAPDGRQLALIHEVDATADQCPTTLCNVGQLDLVNADGSGTRTIATQRGLSYVQFRPPDGRELLYRALIAGQWGLYAMDIDGALVRTVVPPTVPSEMDATFADAAYSPDGKRVFFNMYTPDASFGDPGCCQLFVVNADGTDMHKFISNNGTNWDGEASVSPDGTKVAFWHNLPDQANRVTIINSDGTGQPITTGPALTGGAHWVWSPDSSSILMFPNDAETGVGYLLDPAGGSWKMLPWRSTGDLDWQRTALD